MKHSLSLQTCKFAKEAPDCEINLNKVFTITASL